MTALRLYAEIYRNLGIIAEDEGMLKRAAESLKRLADKFSHDSTLMSKEDFMPIWTRLRKKSAKVKVLLLLIKLR